MADNSTFYGNITQNLITLISNSGEELIFGLYQGIGTSMLEVSILLVFGWLVWNIVKQSYLNQQSPKDTFWHIFPAMIFFQVAVNPAFFLNDIYKPLMHFFSHAPSDIVEMISTGSIGIDSTQALFVNLDYQLMLIHQVLDSLNEQAGFFSADKYTSIIYGWAVKGVFIALQAAFVGMYALSLLAVSVIFGLMPIGIALAAVPPLRFILTSMIRGLFTFGLMPMVSAICMSLVVKMMGGTVLLAEQYLQNPETGSIPQAFYITGLISGLVGLYLILMTGTFAAMITSGAVSDGFGQVIKGKRCHCSDLYLFIR